MAFLTSGLATASLWLLWGGLSSVARYPRVLAQSSSIDLQWGDIVPTADLAWHTCENTFQCARLEVPLNYSEPTGRKAAIALIRLPATVPEGSPLYRGPVLFNPGGPGGSGVDFIRSLGPALATYLGPQFDIVGFDPRGIARSTPRATFFDSNAEREVYFQNLQRVVRPHDINGIAQLWAKAQVLGDLAERHDDGYLPHINTPNTATDMLRIAQAHGREKVQYWGFSYGTILGATFAAMYPDKVERLVIDGVMDSEDYYATTWLTNLADTNNGFDFFLESCADVGPTICPIHSSDPEDIRRNVTALFDRIQKRPVPARAREKYGVVDYNLLRLSMLTALYSPYSLWEFTSQALHALSNGDGTGILSLFGSPPAKCAVDDYAEVIEGFSAVHCNDGDEVSTSFGDLVEHYQTLTKASNWGDAWGWTHATCIGYPSVEKGFRGPFIGNTSHPLLVIGNTADPVTPLVSAKKMAEGFRGAVVLTQDSPGHCSINAPSLCTQDYVSRYFQDGTLPEPETVCQPLVKNPFLGLPGREEAERQAILQPADGELWDALAELAHNFRFIPFSSLR